MPAAARPARGRALRWLAGAVAALGAQAALAAEEGSDLTRLMALDLPVRNGLIALHYSPSARAPAEIYADALERAVGWYRGKTGWTGHLVMAVLNADDWAKVSGAIPYPSPYSENASSLVVMPDRIDRHPGFDQWDLEPVALNAALTFHEIGHVIASQTGIWSNNTWVNELVANAFLAAYVRAERPAFAGLLNGVPPRFTDFGRYTALVDFDDIYYSMGALNYAWFQFKIAALADYLVSGQDFADVVAALRREFPPATGSAREPLLATFERLERIRPGITAKARDLLIDSTLTVVPTHPCDPDPKEAGVSVPFIIDNRSPKPVAFNTIADIEFALGVELLRGDLPAEADIGTMAAGLLASEKYATRLDPGQQLAFDAQRIGRQWYIVGGDCFTVPAEPARFVWTGR